jgi:hypothetical protein
MKKQVIQISVTTNYSLFNYLPMNRNINSEQVEKLVESIRAIGITRQVICVRTNAIDGELKTYVIDGQHLVHACQRENIPVEYRYIEIKDETDIVRKMAYYNNSGKSWNLLDYINAWMYSNPDYLILKKYKNLYNLEPLMIASICYNENQFKQNSTMSNIIKNGEFKIMNVNAEEMCKKFSDLFIKIGKADRWVKFNFLSNFIKAYGENYNHENVLKNIELNINVVKLMTDTTVANHFIQQKVFNII